MIAQETTSIELLVAYAHRVLRVAVERAAERRGRAFDPVASLYVAERDAFEILDAGVAAQALVAAVEGPPLVVPRALLAALSSFERAALSLLLGIALTPRIERVIGFLHDDLTRRSVTIGLLLDLFADGLAERARGLDAFGSSGLLVRLQIVATAGDEHHLGTRVQLDPAFFSRFIGLRALDRRLLPFAQQTMPESNAPAALDRAAPGVPTILWGGDAAALSDRARDRARAAGRGLLRITSDAPPALTTLAAREALWDDAVLSVAAATPAAALQAARALAGLPLEILIEAPAGISNSEGFAHDRVDGPARRSDLASIAQPLPHGKRIVARRGMERLVLPAAKLRALDAIVARMEHRATVVEAWGVESGSSAGGIRCLFSGPPGTGKTLAAEAISARLQRDLYVIDVSAVVSKFIGDTEKILAEVFDEAGRAKVCLFFDEADALFGKRGEQKDAHDKYANIETAYLLQAIDAYPDLVVLATNMRGNIDDALTRRIDVFVDFPMPDLPARRRLWELALARAPYAGADAAHVAERFALSGGSIQSAGVAAAYQAAAEGRSIERVDLMRAARDEMAKSGKVAGRVELGEHYDELAGQA